MWAAVYFTEPVRHHPPLAGTVHDLPRPPSTPHRATRPVLMMRIHTAHSTYYCYWVLSI
jgi:hypothetical protein